MLVTWHSTEGWVVYRRLGKIWMRVSLSSLMPCVEALLKCQRSSYTKVPCTGNTRRLLTTCIGEVLHMHDFEYQCCQLEDIFRWKEKNEHEEKHLDMHLSRLANHVCDVSGNTRWIAFMWKYIPKTIVYHCFIKLSRMLHEIDRNTSITLCITSRTQRDT